MTDLSITLPTKLPTTDDFRFDLIPMSRIEAFIRGRAALTHLATTKREYSAFAAANQTAEHYMELTQ